MKKSKKILLLVIAGIIVVLAAAAVLLFTIGPLGRGVCDVYLVKDLSEGGFFDQGTESFGSVRADGFQNVMISNTQTVTEIYVKEGQKVRKGDPLLSFDSTLSEIELERAGLEVDRLTLDLETARRELYEIYQMLPSSERLITPDNSGLKFKPVKTPYVISGKGTKKDPMFLITDKNDVFDTEYFSDILPKNTDTLYAVFLNREHNAVNGEILSSFGLILYFDEDGISFKPFDPVIPEEIRKYDKPKEPYYQHEGSDYTAAELASMQREKEAEIREKELELKKADLEYKRMLEEVGDGIVRAKKAGTVQAVRDPKEAFSDNLPVVEVSSGGGYYLDVAVSEMDLASRKVGDTVSVEAYFSETYCDGTIQKIETTPINNPDAYTGGNQNVSFYPCTIFIDGSEHLTAGESAVVHFQTAEMTDDSIYLDNMFLRRDDEGPYVLAADENGLLQKRRVKTGRDLYGSSTQIKEGLTREDFIAFPYGKKAKEGSKVNITTTDTLYNY